MCNNPFTAREVEIIIYCMPFRITKTTLIGYLAKIDQDEHLKLSPQSHILFQNVFLTRNIASP